MASPPDETPAVNPYEAPRTEPGAPGAAPDVAAAFDPSVLKKFRDQSLALGVLWIVVGLVTAGAFGFLAARTRAMPEAGGVEVGAVFVAGAAVGAAWVVLGVLTLLKQVWAVYTGLALSYLSLAGNLYSLNLCPLVVLILVILQAHRVIRWAKDLQAAGVPLNARPPRKA